MALFFPFCLIYAIGRESDDVLVVGADHANFWLETQPLGGYMYAKRDLETAWNNIQIFIDFQNEQGRLPGMIGYVDHTLIPHHGRFRTRCIGY